jgi:hypothetical protein
LFTLARGELFEIDSGHGGADGQAGALR